MLITIKIILVVLGVAVFVSCMIFIAYFVMKIPNSHYNSYNTTDNFTVENELRKQTDILERERIERYNRDMITPPKFK